MSSCLTLKLVVIRIGCGCALAGCVASSGAGAKLAAEEPFVPGPTSQAQARRIAVATLSRVALPPRAKLLAVEPDRPSRAPEGHEVERRERWSIRGGSRSVLTYLRAHPPAGARLRSRGLGEGVASLEYAWPLSVGFVATRTLLERVVARARASTEVTFTADVMWLIARSASERVPEGAREVDVEVRRPQQPPSTFFAVTEPSKVAALVHEVDALPIEQPGLGYSCGSEPIGDPVTEFLFRTGRGGRVLASAGQTSRIRGRTFACDSMWFTVEGRAHRSLLEGPRLVALAEHLLGAPLRPPR
jgi:hypothetical protein